MAGTWQSAEEQRSLGMCMPIVSTLKPEQKTQKIQNPKYTKSMFCEKKEKKKHN